jgi:hypothetical protein
MKTRFAAALVFATAAGPLALAGSGGLAEKYALRLTADRDTVCLDKRITFTARVVPRRRRVRIDLYLKDEAEPIASAVTGWLGRVTFTYTPSERGPLTFYAVAEELDRLRSNDVVVDVVEIELEVNDTSSQTDDLVQIKDTVCQQRFKVSCRARILTPPSASKDIQVTLKNPDRRLRFVVDGGFEPTKVVQLPKNGGWASFEIVGEARSRKKDDASIEAHVDYDGACATEDATVFYFISPRLDMQAPGNYSLVRRRYQPVGGHAVTYSAEATIKPDGLDCQAPQIGNLRVGIVQNVPSSFTEVVFDSPRMFWLPGVPDGKVVQVPRYYSDYKLLPSNLQDSSAADDPLYRKSTAKLLRPCPGSGPATDFDDPAVLARLLQVAFPVRDLDGNEAGAVVYFLGHISIDDDYRAWCAVYNNKTDDISVLLERDWVVDIRSDRGRQKARIGRARRASHCPKTGPPFAKDVAQATPFTTVQSTQWYFITSPDQFP